MGGIIEELRIEDDSEVRELEHLFSWATQVGRGEIQLDGFCYFEDTDDEPLLVRCSAVTSISPGNRESMSLITVGGERFSVRGSYEATIAKVLGSEFRSPRS
jgi:hypothetical protein